MGNHYPGYAFLGYDCWVRRERIPASLLACYDRTFAVAETNPGEIDPETGRSFGALWLDVADDIRERAAPPARSRRPPCFSTGRRPAQARRTSCARCDAFAEDAATITGPAWDFLPFRDNRYVIRRDRRQRTAWRAVCSDRCQFISRSSRFPLIPTACTRSSTERVDERRNRALPSEGKGHTFESCRVRQ